MISRTSVILFISIVVTLKIYSQDLPSFPMSTSFKNSIKYKWDHKKVSDTKKLSTMESLENWEHKDFGTLTLSSKVKHSGEKSLRLTSPTKAKKPGPEKGRPFGAARMLYKVDSENWEDWNRISFWVYPDLPGFQTVSLSLIFYNDGEDKVPGPYDRNGYNYVILNNHEWNQVNWEIEHLGREKVTGIELRYRLQGNEPGTTDTVNYYFDELELQKVEPDYYEGWEVAPGQIAFSHIGYALEYKKIALATGLETTKFAILDATSQKIEFQNTIEKRITDIGEFQVMDFSEFNKTGDYILKAGEIETRVFSINTFQNIFRETIIKSNNLFYTLRCGDDIPNIHHVCHRDAHTTHKKKTIISNGGWHDAGDLSQSSANTSEAIYGLFSAAESLKNTDPDLADRLIQEGEWGVDWLLKTRFGDGYRTMWTTIDFWTDGIIGNVDDPHSNARNSSFGNFLASQAEAKASQLIQTTDLRRAKYALTAAEEDWAFARNNSRRESLMTAALGLNSSLLLFNITEKEKYKIAALEYGNYITQCQAKNNLVTDRFSRGFFYETSAHEKILQFDHLGWEQAPITGLVNLCKTFPHHSNIREWRKSLRLYMDYYLEMTQFTAPYRMLPAGIYDLNQARDDVEKIQIQKGTPLSDRYYLKKFPVWKTFRGNNGVILSQAYGLAIAGKYFDDETVMELAYQQLQWVMGLNPFCQSLMYGAGYDFASQYSAMCGDIVGGLPVGIQTHFNRDVPYYPTENCYNWKEIWVHPSAKWLELMSVFY